MKACPPKEYTTIGNANKKGQVQQLCYKKDYTRIPEFAIPDFLNSDQLHGWKFD